MSTAVTASGSAGSARLAPGAGLDAPGRLGFGRLVGVEFRKLVDTVGGRWVIGAILVTTLLALLALWFIDSSGQARSFDLFFSGVMLPQGLLLPILGVLAATQEWTHRTALVTFTLEPRRLRVIVAKIVASFLLALGGVLAGMALAALFTLLASLTGGAAADAWSIRGWPLAGNVVQLLIGVLIGSGFGLLFGVTWLALVAYFVLPTVLSILVLWEPAAKVLPWCDINAAASPLSSGQALTATQWQQFASSFCVWIVLPIALGALLTLRREVK